MKTRKKILVWLTMVLPLLGMLLAGRPVGATQTNMPADGYMGSGSRTTAEFQQGIEDMCSVIMELIGGRAEHSAVTLSSDAFAPSVDYSVYPILPETGTADNLATINATGVRDGSIVLIRNSSATNTITIKDGSGNIHLADSTDYAINSTGDYIALIYRSTGWYEIFRTTGNLLKVLPGNRSETTATIASGMLPLTQAVVKVEGEGSTSDNLDGISSTFNGNLCIIRATNASHVITVRNNQSVSAGYYKILTADSTDLVCDSLTKYILLQKDVSGTAWREVFRGGFSSSTSFSVSSVSGAFAMNGGSLTTYKCDTSAGAGTGTLATSPADGRIYNVWATSSANDLTIQTTGGELIYFPDNTTSTSFVLKATDGVPLLQAVTGGYRII